MEDYEDNDSGTFSFGFLFGAVAGMLLGFMIAPAPGREMREKLRDEAGEGMTRARKAAGEVADAVRKVTPGEG
jgi:gas vesicle protein